VTLHIESKDSAGHVSIDSDIRLGLDFYDYHDSDDCLVTLKCPLVVRQGRGIQSPSVGVI
jgi:hypothetical protein